MSVLENCYGKPGQEKGGRSAPRQEPEAGKDAPAPSRSDWLLAATIFCGTAIFVWWRSFSRVPLVNDEGIYIDGAVRILGGEFPFRDFFALTGPGSFWLLAAVFGLFGVSLGLARLVPALAIAALTAAVFWLTSRFTSRRSALLFALFFFLLETARSGQLVVNHRWDSSALAVLSLVAGVIAIQRSSRHAWLAAGALGATAAWFTPPVGLVLISTTVWMAWRHDNRRWLAPYLTGCLGISIAWALFLAVQGSLIPMISHMAWTASHYSSANRMPYGSVVGGYAAMLDAAQAAPPFLRWWLIAGVALPAVLPPVVWLGWGSRIWAARRQGVALPGTISFLLLNSFALLLSPYPRLDVWHLAFVSPVFYPLAAVLVERCNLPTVRRAVLLTWSVFAGFLLLTSLSGSRGKDTLHTPAGSISGDPADMAFIRQAMEHINPGDTLFVFPYQPILYFLTGGVNTNRYSFLQPGMMTSGDEQRAIEDLQLRPPQWVIFFEVHPSAYLRIWPSSDPSRLRMPAIEEFIHNHYTERAKLHHPYAPALLMERKSQPVNSG